MANSRPSFLSLPYSIRREIYILAGLSRFCPFAIITEQEASSRATPPQHQHQWPPPPPGIQRRSWRDCIYPKLAFGHSGRVSDSEPGCYCPKIPKQLLLVSKAVYNDTCDILYGENSFIVRAHEAKALNILKSLSIHAIHVMRYLMVRLNCWPCRRGHHRANFSRRLCMTCQTPIASSDCPLRTGDSESEDMVQSWFEVCQILESNLVAGRLTLSFICDVDDMEIAKRILEPLENIPRLRSCDIRLGRKRNDDLRSLARKTCLKLTAANQLPEHGSSHVSFADLPREIRLRILEFTHLGKHGHPRHYTKLAIEKKTLVQREGGHNLILQKMCCNACNFTKKDCCCPLRYAAYSASCQCRILPLELMLVSRQMDIDASEILYSTNTFVFRDAFDSTLGFLQSLRPNTLRLLRHVAFALEPSQTGNWSLQEEAWNSLIRFVRDNFSVSSLIVTIDAECDGETALWADQNPDTLNAMHETYVGVTRVVKDLLFGLRGYYLELIVDLVVDDELAPMLEEEVMGPEWRVDKSRHI